MVRHDKVWSKIKAVFGQMSDRYSTSVRGGEGEEGACTHIQAHVCALAHDTCACLPLVQVMTAVSVALTDIPSPNKPTKLCRWLLLSECG